MLKKDFSFSDLVQNLLNILGVLSVLSVVLFFIGLLNYYVYYSVLGVDIKFLDFEYHQYVFNGFMENLFLVLMILYLIVIYFTIFYDIYRLQREYFDLKKDVLKSNDDELNNKIFEMELKLDGLFNLRDEALKRVVRIFNRMFAPSLLTIVGGLLISIYFHNYRFIFGFSSFALNLIIIFLLIHFFRRMIQTKDVLYEFMFVLLPTIVFILFALPSITGYFSAKQKIKIDDFKTYSVIIKDAEALDNAKFVYYGKAHYFFYVNGTMEIIPESEVSKLVRK